MNKLAVIPLISMGLVIWVKFITCLSVWSL